VPADRTLTERLLSMSGTQKRILDHLHGAEELEPLSRLSQQLQKGDSEMFYRLEALRLLGFVRFELGAEAAYGLTPELRRVWRGQTPR
jgi:DNA-binding IclR family transcriptional regulator